MITTAAHSSEREYKCRATNSAEKTTIILVGKKEHINATIITITALSILDINPMSLLIKVKTINASKNFRIGTIKDSHLE